MSRKSHKRPIRVDWHQNHDRLSRAYLDLVKEHGRAPTIAQLSEAANLSAAAVKRHMKYLKFTPTKHPARVLTDSVIIGLASKAAAGDSAAAKLWFQVMEGWSEKTRTEMSITDVDEAIESELARLAGGGEAPSAPATPGT